MKFVFAAFLVVAAVSACSPRSKSEIIPGRSLSSEEMSIVAAALRADIKAVSSEHPSIVLDQTSTWMPRPEDEPQVPEGFPREEWLAQNPPVPAILRSANDSVFRIADSTVLGGVQVFSRQRYVRESRSESKARKLAREFGGRQPRVFQVSRPVIDPNGHAHLLVHVRNGWNGTGSVSYYVATQATNAWSAELKRILVLYN